MTRTVAELWAMWQPRAKVDVYPFDFAPYDAVERAMAGLTSVLDREAWAAAFSAEAAPYEQRAREATARDDRPAARQHYLQAYALYRVARFPCMNSTGKQAAYLKSQECFLNARRLDEAPVERVEMPFEGRPGEGDRVVGYLRRPRGQSRPPILVAWAGIDTFKEDRIQTTDPYFARGMATMTIDMPGTGDAPLPGSEDAERMWDAVFDWIATRPDLDADRIGLWGGSTGAHWATKVAHTHRERVAAVLSQGGHMGRGEDHSQAATVPHMVSWLCAKLGLSR
jgi:esterase FrsA